MKGAFQSCAHLVLQGKYEKKRGLCQCVKPGRMWRLRGKGSRPVARRLHATKAGAAQAACNRMLLVQPHCSTTYTPT